jgi:hypothetical protein
MTSELKQRLETVCKSLSVGMIDPTRSAAGLVKLASMDVRMVTSFTSLLNGSLDYKQEQKTKVSRIFKYTSNHSFDQRDLSKRIDSMNLFLSTHPELKTNHILLRRCTLSWIGPESVPFLVDIARGQADEEMRTNKMMQTAKWFLLVHAKNV